jgi:hypothetical protein
MNELIRRCDVEPASLWLATTDADSVVPAHWLERQLRYAASGCDAVLGTVTVSDWTGRPPQLAPIFAAHYAYRGGTHPHVHGANLGVRASAYLAAGGFSTLATAEDHAMLSALTSIGCVAKHVTDIAVETSARPVARAPGGFSELLTRLSAGQGCQADS